MNASLKRAVEHGQCACETGITLLSMLVLFLVALAIAGLRHSTENMLNDRSRAVHRLDAPLAYETSSFSWCGAPLAYETPQVGLRGIVSSQPRCRPEGDCAGNDAPFAYETTEAFEITGLYNSILTSSCRAPLAYETDKINILISF